MKKIIYCYATQKPKLKLNRKERARELLAEWLCLPYPISEKQGCFLGYPVTGYAMEGFPGRKQKRTERTLKSLKKRIRKREMQESGTEAQDAFLFCSWENVGYPLELLEQYYAWMRKKETAVCAAEQLIVLDWDISDELFDLEDNVTFVSQICGEYNYITVVTERKEAWAALVEECYEEYGLWLRCVLDDARMCFREKKTLILDFGKAGRKCLRNLPKDSVYMDFYRAEEKRHVISVKCRKIPYFSPCNALDTMLKDTV